MGNQIKGSEMSKSKVRQKLKRKVEEKKQDSKEESKSEWHRCRGARLVVETDEFSLNVPIRFERMDSSRVDERRNLKRFTKDGKPVKRKMLGENAHFGYVAKQENGEWKEVNKSKVVRKQKIDGEWVEVSKYKYDSENVWKPKAFIDRERITDFLIEKFYELGSDVGGLWRLADYLDKRDQVAVLDDVVISTGYRKYWGLLYPVIEDGKYTFVLALTRTKLHYKHLSKPKPEEPTEPETTTKRTPKSGIQMKL